ncbi:MAG: tRNA pseudouridine(13) synthase TruD, partial [Candidatus Thorarchaeota archaeon]
MDSIQLRESHKIEKKMGINYYCSHTDGIQGRLRKFPKDFKVEEILPNGRIISINDEDFSFGESEPGLFTEFVLLKKNVESHKAQLKIAQTLNKKIDDIQVAGTKDKTAITAQRATIWRVPPEKLLEIQIKGIKIRAPRTTIYQTYLGNLRGNHFIITIRELPFDKEEIANRLEAINTEIDNFGGIGNFFGHQRFGSRRPISHEVGKFILMGDIEKAVNYYLSEISEDEHELTKKARQLYVETNDPKITLAAFSNEMLFERLILNHLIKRPRDFLGAFQILPKNLQRLFIHSYQSYIWNCA